jgi:hypothetical protein
MPVDLALVGGKLFVLDLGQRAILAVDPANGDRTIAYKADALAAGSLLYPMGIAATGRGEIVTVDPRRAAAIAVDLETGAARHRSCHWRSDKGLASLSNVIFQLDRQLWPEPPRRRWRDGPRSAIDAAIHALGVGRTAAV